ncbi:hypothetical protein QF036_000269 [Arthrobacter globiformis]|nr:hypothetical protein [Arthrobacter globiformis]
MPNNELPSGSATTRRSCISGRDTTPGRATMGRSRPMSTLPFTSPSIWSVETSSRSTKDTRGIFSAARRSISGSALWPAIAVYPTVMVPACPDETRRTSKSVLMHMSRICRARGSSVAPAAVSSTFRLVRPKSCAPSFFSSIWIWRLSGGCVMLSRSAAAPKCSSSATATNASN